MRCVEGLVQVGDFGSARSAIREGYHWAEQDPPDRALASHFSNDAAKVRLIIQGVGARQRYCPTLLTAWA